MHMADLYPAGNVFWAVHETDIDPAAQPSSANSTIVASKLRLFQVERVEKVFDQIVFSRDMLRFVVSFYCR
jgi:sn1-specific diacylglycerol lipase